MDGIVEVDRRGVRDQGGVSTAVVVVLAGKAISCGRRVDSGVGVCAEVGVDDGLATCEAESCSGAQCASRAASRSGVGLAPDEVEGDARTHWPTEKSRAFLARPRGGQIGVDSVLRG